jgi:hypothetical protein
MIKAGGNIISFQWVEPGKSFIRDQKVISPVIPQKLSSGLPLGLAQGIACWPLEIIGQT